MISGILRPDDGTVAIEDHDVWCLARNRIADLRLKTIGFVFRSCHLFPRRTTAEDVAVPLNLRHGNWDETLAAAHKRLEQVDWRTARNCRRPPSAVASSSARGGAR